MKRRLFTFAIAALALCSAAIGATLTPIGSLNPAGSTAGQAIVSAGPSASPAWGTVVAGSLAPVTANTFIANTTGSTAAPSAKALPSCSTANSALKYTSGTGLTCGTTFSLTSGDLSQFASTTSAQLAGVLSNETGTGVVVFGTSPTITTPNIVGATTNSNPAAGSVGNYSCAQVTPGGSPTGCTTNSSTTVSLTTGTPANVTSLALQAGIYQCHGSVGFTAGGATSVTQIMGAISTTSATFPTIPSFSTILMAPNQTGGTMQFPGLNTRVALASPGTVYLVAQATFSVSTESAFGFIGCWRMA